MMMKVMVMMTRLKFQEEGGRLCVCPNRMLTQHSTRYVTVAVHFKKLFGSLRSISSFSYPMLGQQTIDLCQGGGGVHIY